MRVPVALLTLPYLTAATLGLLLFDAVPERLLFASASAAVLATVAGFGFLAEDEPLAIIFVVVLGGACAGFVAGHAFARDVYRATLLTWFEGTPSAADEVATIEGILREDAAAGPVPLVIDVQRAT